MAPAAEPLILTLDLDETSFGFFQALRQRYFPPERNFIPAHVTLFHALPGEALEQIGADLTLLCGLQPPFELRFPGLRSLGRGVAAELEAAPLLQLRGRLAGDWAAWLTPQDRQPYRPHLTIQNKVAPGEAKERMTLLSAGWNPPPGRALGLRLWRYRGGPWEALETYTFSPAADTGSRN